MLAFEQLPQIDLDEMERLVNADIAADLRCLGAQIVKTEETQ